MTCINCKHGRAIDGGRITFCLKETVSRLDLKADKCSDFEEKKRELDDLSWIAEVIAERLSRKGWGQDTFYLKLSLAEREYLMKLLKEEAEKGKGE